jgi:two-component system chemotaxis response regulator CheB
MVVVGASAGGVEALVTLMRELPGDLAAAVLVVLHIAPEATSLLPKILDRAGPLPVRGIHGSCPVEPGTVTVAQPNHHLVVHAGEVRSELGPRENGHRPAVDVLFRSAAHGYGPRVQGLVLSGMRDDGRAGLGEIKAHGGLALVQDPEDALYPQMPSAALATVAVDHVGTVPELAHAIARASREVARPTAMSGGADGPGAHPDTSGPASGLTCPECGGALWEHGAGTSGHAFDCHVGHRFSPESLVDEQGRMLEAALWTALRALQERSALLRRMAQRMRDVGNERTARRSEEQAARLDEQAAVIRSAVLATAEHAEAPPAQGAW